MTVGEPLGAAPLGGAFKLTTSGPRHTARSLLSGWVGLAGLLATGLVIAVSAARTGVLLPASIRSLPGWLVGPFGRHGIDLGIGGLIAVFTLMLISYAVAMRAADQLSGRVVLICIAALNALALLAPPLLSTDVFSYMAYGRMAALYGSNPYLHGPNTILDPLTPLVGTQWAATPTAYGPLFTAISSLLAPLTIAAGVVAYKMIAAASVFVIVVVVWHAARLRGLNPVKAVALVGLNPVIVVFGVGGGHNDLLMLAFLVTGVYVLLMQKERTSGVLIVAATVVKFTAGLLLPFAFAASAARGDSSRRRLALLTGVVVSGVLALILGFALFGSGPLHLLGTVHQIQNEGGAQSVPGLILNLLGLGGLNSAASLVLDAGLVVWLVWLVRRVWKGQLDWIAGAGWATFGLLITAGLLVPWYVGWLVPLAALSGDRRLLIAAVLMTGIGLTTL
ncbi:MAG TPA: polyprenol phosphomannose-dependent alpha 1,6 mannosyltransferase MptB [Solirubrobacteraceae bacterium]|nr:polyprenol phosphomannose-dependent alpha 1,6 mannosyltransferase MptB [Solirubrobacteraceae bacterium]